MKSTKMKLMGRVVVGMLIVALFCLASYVLLCQLPVTSPQVSEPVPTNTESHDEGLALIDATNLLEHDKELLQIKQSLLKQLRDLEKKCVKASQELMERLRKIDELGLEIAKLNSTLEHLKSSVKYLEISQQELKLRQAPRILKPIRLFATEDENYFMTAPANSDSCDMEHCFDYSRCPLTSAFPVFVDRYFASSCKNDSVLDLVKAFAQSPYSVTDPAKACIFVLPVCSSKDLARLSATENWRGDGRNHLVLMGENITSTRDSVLGRAMLAMHKVSLYRPRFDVMVPQFELSGESPEQFLPAQVPARRKLLIYFEGHFSESNTTTVQRDHEPVLQALLDMKESAVEASAIRVVLSCNKTSDPCHKDTWCFCDIPSRRAEQLKTATFSLTLSNGNDDPTTLLRILDGLKYGAIPVVLGTVVLPLEENIDWLRSVIRLPKARAPELYSILRSIRDEDILSYRSMGRRVWDAYFASPYRSAAAILDTLRIRLNIPAVAMRDWVSPSVFNKTFQPLWQDLPRTEMEENVGPIESPFASDTFQRNFTSTTLDAYARWNVHFDAGRLFPFTPYSPDLPGEAKFCGSEFGFRAIGGGAGGSGLEFSEALGGNRPREQFTVVILTYQREAILCATLQRLNNLPYLNKVIVVWNSPVEPSDALVLPKIHVPIHVHKASVNSLNNRFLPFDVIETEAVLSMDDDIQLRHDEINFAFRVWRENRERIVGFPARYHAWDSEHKSWLYNSNYTCEYSMVLTGASFFHKYYMYLYTHMMPAAIRRKVDEFMNCEDIAMNFLVSHQTRKPPIKVTSRWTFRCTDCPISLWEDDSHFMERHTCVQFFEKIYGYMPLLNTQFRADSVLFKTRIPPDKQKCFKMI